jgi:hypothetical protein
MKALVQIAVLMFVLGLAVPAAAEDAHHPPGAAPTSPAPSQGMAERPGMGMMGQGNMMGDGMMHGGMSQMMGMMQMMQGGGHFDGRLAFIKAELKITSAQDKVWEDFANALRQAAARVRDAKSAMRAMPSGMAPNVSPPQLLEQHEKQLMAQLDAVRVVKPALGPFYDSLSEDQKKTLAQLHPMFHGMF